MKHVIIILILPLLILFHNNTLSQVIEQDYFKHDKKNLKKERLRENIRGFHISTLFGGNIPDFTDYDVYWDKDYQTLEWFNYWEEYELASEKTIPYIYDIELGYLMKIKKYSKKPRIYLEYSFNYLNSYSVTNFKQCKPSIGIWFWRWLNIYTFYSLNKYSFTGTSNGKNTYCIESHVGDYVHKVYDPNIEIKPNGAGLGIKLAYNELDIQTTKGSGSDISALVYIEYFPERSLSNNTSFKYFKFHFQFGWGNKFRGIFGTTYFDFKPVIYADYNPNYKIIIDRHLSMFVKLQYNFLQ